MKNDDSSEYGAQLASYPPPVSIGMPVYNGEPFIREALDSLLAQTFTDFELIISDNASNDGTEAICREYADKDARIRYIRQKKNRGAAANFQFLLEEAAGEYFMWAAADDKWHPEWVQQLLPMAVRTQGLAYGMVRSIDEQGNSLSHPANGRILSYAGPRLIRRAKYFCEPGLLGKANPIYSIFAKESITSEEMAILRSDVSGADMLFVYSLLKRMPILSTKAVFIMKRIIAFQTPTGRVVSQGKSKPFTSLSCNKATKTIKRSALLSMSYLRLSDPIEIVLYTLFFPFVVVVDLAFTAWMRMTLFKKWR